MAFSHQLGGAVYALLPRIFAIALNGYYSTSKARGITTSSSLATVPDTLECMLARLGSRLCY